MRFWFPLTRLIMNLGENHVKGWFGRLYVKMIGKAPTPVGKNYFCQVLLRTAGVYLWRALTLLSLLAEWSASDQAQERPCLARDSTSSLPASVVETADAFVIFSTFEGFSRVLRHCSFTYSYLNTAGPRSVTFEVEPQQLSLLNNQALSWTSLCITQVCIHLS